MTTPARSRWVRPAPFGPPIRIDPVLKPGGGVRHLVHLGPADARRYLEAVRPVLPIVERASGPWAPANRGRVTPGGLALEDWRAARGRFRAAARSNLDGAASVFLGDVEDCYGSIGSSTVMSALRRLGIDAVDAGRVGAILADLERRGVRGLPVGPDASAILGNAVLLLVDHAFASGGVDLPPVGRRRGGLRPEPGRRDARPRRVPSGPRAPRPSGERRQDDGR